MYDNVYNFRQQGAGSNLFAQAYKYISFKSYNLRFLNLGIVPLSNDIEYRAHYANLALS